MLDAAEAARRRELHHRAFAPGGALSDAETAELRELESRRAGGPSTGSGTQLQHGPSTGSGTQLQARPSDWVAEPGPRGPEAPGGAKRRLEGAGGIEAPKNGPSTGSGAQAEGSPPTEPADQQTAPRRKAW